MLDITQILLEPEYHGDQRDRLPVIGSIGTEVYTVAEFTKVS